ncbi:hypothetical protein ACQKOM_10580 [Peribacillus frigoritolerans]|uniref:hypothetical protein n=1 Tax=Peribacillus frigoritolerans TaxID=450367 RepID=UPI003D070711
MGHYPFMMRKIHLLYAGPAGLAIEIGREINPRIWGEVCLYQYDASKTPEINMCYQFNR